MVLFWASIAGLILWLGGMERVKGWLQPAHGGWVWCLLAVGVGLLSLPGFVAHWVVLRPPAVLFAWLAFALINPWFEEGYWRGLLIDATTRWGGVLSVAYSATWFAVSHPLVWGVHSEALGHWVIVPVLAVIGMVWAMAYRRSGSLRWPHRGTHVRQPVRVVGPGVAQHPSAVRAMKRDACSKNCLRTTTETPSDRLTTSPLTNRRETRRLWSEVELTIRFFNSQCSSMARPFYLATALRAAVRMSRSTWGRIDRRSGALDSHKGGNAP